MYILPISAQEVEERLKKIPVIKEEIVDQEYSPESTNAQSGIAVAEALKRTAALIVTIGGDGIASHNSTEILDHISKGGVAYLFADYTYMPIIASTDGSGVMAYWVGDDLVGGHYIIYNNEVTYTELDIASGAIVSDLEKSAIRHTEQKLTKQQQEQARANIGAIGQGEKIDLELANIANVGVLSFKDPNGYKCSIRPFSSNKEEKGLVFTDANEGDLVLSGVADGVEESDAVNKRQLDVAIERISELEKLEKIVAALVGKVEGLIKFYVNDKMFVAEPDTTWEEWINSEYCSDDKFDIRHADRQLMYDNQTFSPDEEGNLVKAESKIEANYHYYVL